MPNRGKETLLVQHGGHTNDPQFLIGGKGNDELIIMPICRGINKHLPATACHLYDMVKTKKTPPQGEDVTTMQHTCSCGDPAPAAHGYSR
jgi:hypothetical protein